VTDTPAEAATTRTPPRNDTQWIGNDSTLPGVALGRFTTTLLDQLIYTGAMWRHIGKHPSQVPRKLLCGYSSDTTIGVDRKDESIARQQTEGTSE